MAFFDNLGSQLEQQFGLGENKLSNLDIVRDGTAQKYGKLGDFAKNIDQSAERKWVEDGFYRPDLYNQQAKNLEVLMQEPDITVLIKKRAFSSLAENFRRDLVSEQDTLFLKATKILFQNKCKQIAAFERLSKIESISKEYGRIDYHLLPILFASTDALDSLSGSLSTPLQQSLSGFKKTVDKVREILTLNRDTNYTSWIVDLDSIFKTDFGEGSGVIELTSITGISTTTTIRFNDGGASLNVEDPYNIMLITNLDIDKALSDAQNVNYNSSFYQLGIQALNQTISDSTTKLNQIRANRGANPIRFIANPDTFLGKRLRAIIDYSGDEINFNYSPLGTIESQSNYSNAVNSVIGITSNATSASTALSLDPKDLINGVLGINGLTPEEVQIFEQIASQYFNLMQEQQNARKEYKNYNQDPKIEYARKKLRLHYGNKLIFQPMDVVHIYIDSKRQLDSKITGGLQTSFNANGFLQSASNTVQDIKDFFNVATNQSIEKSIIVGNDFPNWLWMIFRNQIVNDTSGTHVFAGIVGDSSVSYSNGKYNISVNINNQAKYFNMGVVNFKPAADVFNGALFDPLTPFDIQFDSVTGFQKDSVPDLLPENKEIIKSTFIKYKNGPYSGRRPTEKNYLQDADRIKNNSVRRVFYDPDGFVYKWKEGIGAITLFGQSNLPNDEISPASPALTADPFAGQDVMNALSLLICGEPYNFATFYKAASKIDNYAPDPITGKNSSTSYFRSLQSDLKYRNLIYGDFIPFKKLTVDNNTFAKMVSGEIRANNLNSELAVLNKRRADLADKIATFQSSAKTQYFDDTAKKIAAEILDLDKQINDKIEAINRELDTGNSTKGNKKPFSVIGNDISYNYDESFSVGPDDKNNLSEEQADEIRKKVNFLTRRLSWKVRANQDANLFIVDDSYDKDYDIQAFTYDFVNPELFKSEYTTPGDKIPDIAMKLELEVFIDTQGHIQVRPPKYNRIPSSVFYRMLRLKNDYGIQLYPQFLEELFVNQINNALSLVETKEDEIRIFCAAIGKTTDKDAEDFINKSSASYGSGGNKFKFLSSRVTGKILSGYEGLYNLFISKDPDVQNASQQGKLEAQNATLNRALGAVVSQNSISQLFDFKTQSDIVNRNFVIQQDSNNNYKVSPVYSDAPKLTTTEDAAYNTIDSINNRLMISTGQKIDIKQLFSNSTKYLSGAGLSSVDLLNITQNIAERLNERQRLIKVASNAIKNAKEGASLAENKDNEGNKLLYPNLYDTKNIPAALKYMIEDESYDDLGPGSGKRYVIEDYDIISFTYNEKAPEHTVIQVSGVIDLALGQNNVDGVSAFDDNANGITTAAAVDYDMWRMYGVRSPQTITAPFLNNPETQSAPYAVSLLNQSRKNILRASMTVVGNEYYQPGEVVYVKKLDMLFYVEAVNHNFTYGSSFTTSLTLCYGHNPGEYIPTAVDVIGKILYKNKDITNLVHNGHGQGDVYNQQPLGAIIGNAQNMNDGSLLTNSDAVRDLTYNSKTLANILQLARPALAGSTKDTEVTLELRYFYDSSTTSFVTASSYATNLATEIKKFLIGGNELEDTLFSSTAKQNNLTYLKEFEQQIIITPVDTNIKNKSINVGTTSASADFRYPSKEAYAQARTMLLSQSQNSNTLSSSDIDNVIYNYVVDCWLFFNNKNNTRQ